MVGRGRGFGGNRWIQGSETPGGVADGRETEPGGVRTATRIQTTVMPSRVNTECPYLMCIKYIFMYCYSSTFVYTLSALEI